MGCAEMMCADKAWVDHMASANLMACADATARADPALTSWLAATPCHAPIPWSTRAPPSAAPSATGGSTGDFRGEQRLFRGHHGPLGCGDLVFSSGSVDTGGSIGDQIGSGDLLGCGDPEDAGGYPVSGSPMHTGGFTGDLIGSGDAQAAATQRTPAARYFVSTSVSWLAGQTRAEGGARCRREDGKGL